MQNRTYSERTDEELLGLCEVGETEAFGELARRYQPMAFHAARFILKNEDEAEEQVQESLAKAYEHMDRFRRDAKFSTWLVRIVVNQCLMRLRHFRRARCMSLECLSFTREMARFEPRDQRRSPETELLATENADLLRQEIRRIPPLLRSVFVLRDVEQQAIPDIARTLGISVNAAKGRLLRARAELRIRLTDRLHNPRLRAKSSLQNTF
ncbi:MAG TPA: sigma-70 family RNA polymerase sigma factor [Bryobacteraceae bacterium]|nr:sigma-70 family RNA polymerase sigma factor [Bryobacteraceae bacterium]